MFSTLGAVPDAEIRVLDIIKLSLFKSITDR